MAVCKKCGTPLPEGTKVCPECKTKNLDNAEALLQYVKWEDYTDAYSRKDISDNKVYALLCYIPIVCLFPFIFKAKESAFVKFHANQGVVVFGIHICLAIITAFMSLIWMIPIIGPIFCVISGIIFGIIELANLAAMILGIITSASGEAKEFPLIGKIKLF